MCSKPIRAQIASRESERLSPIQAWKLRQHCRACKECREEQTQMRQIETGLQNLAWEVTPPHVYAALLSQLPELSGAEVPQTIHEDIVLDRNGQVSRRRQRTRWVIAVGAALIIGTGGVVAVPRLRDATMVVLSNYWYEQNRAKAIEEFNAEPVLDSPYMKKATELRRLWKPWAMRHKPELRQMLEADTGNQMALRRIASTLPILPRDKQAGITLQNLDVRGGSFTWEPSPPRKDGLALNWKEDFARFHDIALARSVNYELTRYTLWASGRITAEKSIYYGPLTRELAPPYEELTPRR